MFSKRCAPSTGSRAAGLMVAGCIAAVLVPASAQAAAKIDITPSLAAETVTVGDSAQGQLLLVNGSYGTQAFGYITPSEVTLIPACGTVFVDVSCEDSPGADIHAFSIGNEAQGSGGCPTIFDVSMEVAATGKRSFVPRDPVLLSSSLPQSTCNISFPYTVEHMPVVDANPNIAGVQTNLLGFVRGTWNDPTAVEPPGRSGSQFFVVTATDAGLPPSYAVLGKIKSGWGTISRISSLGDPASGQIGTPRDTATIRKVTVQGG